MPPNSRKASPKFWRTAPRSRSRKPDRAAHQPFHLETRIMKSRASTVAAYLKELPAEQRAVISTMRKTVVANLPRGYGESMSWGMIAYEIPLSRFPTTHNGLPLLYAALASQKNNYALYMMWGFTEPKLMAKLREHFKRAGKKLDMGKACLRFKKLEDLPLDTIAEIIAATPVEKYIEKYESARKKPKN